MTTLATMRARVLLALGNKGGITNLIDANLNEATLQHTFTVQPKEAQVSTTFSVTSAQASYDISSDLSITDLYAVLYVRDNTDDVPLEQGNETEYNNSRQDSTVASNLGAPRKWLHIDDDLILYAQIPNSTARTIGLRYLQRPPTMTSSQDFPLLREHERPVEQLAKALTWLDLGNDAKATVAFDSYNSLITGRFSPEQTEDESPEFRLSPVHNLCRY